MSNASAQVSVIPAGTYRLDPVKSSIEFTVRHLFGLRSAAGTLTVSSGEFTFAEEPGASRLSVSAAASSFATDTAKRDVHVRSADFLDSEAYPEISFLAAGVVRDGTAWLVPGQLTVRGQAAPVELRVVRASSDERGVTIAATGRVDRYAHGVTKMKGMIGRYLDLDLTVVARLS